ncbi:hypothetical protein [Marinobacter vinifirmus]|nr:hypothetical protein [Marinobacter vinifirmus]
MTAHIEIKLLGAVAALAALELVGLDVLAFVSKLAGAVLVSGFAG